MAKKAKKAAPLKAEKTATRTPADEQQTIQIDKLGETITWKVPDAPYKGDGELRSAFAGGVRARAEQVNQATDPNEELTVPTRFGDAKFQQAFADGYHEAARQDGRHLKPKALKGLTTTPPATSRGKRR